MRQKLRVKNNQNQTKEKYKIPGAIVGAADTANKIKNK